MTDSHDRPAADPDAQQGVLNEITALAGMLNLADGDGMNPHPYQTVPLLFATVEQAKYRGTIRRIKHPLESRGLLSDREILYLCKHHAFISPYVETSVRENETGKVISYGISSYGYDLRLAPEFFIFSNATQSDKAYIDPKDFDPDAYIRHEGASVIVPPNGFILARSVEYFKVPKDVTCIVLGKSTYARAGLTTLATPLEAGWEGHVTLEFANTTPRPIKMYANEGCVQILCQRGEPCETDYAKRGGKYQGQTGITLPMA